MLVYIHVQIIIMPTEKQQKLSESWRIQISMWAGMFPAGRRGQHLSTHDTLTGLSPSLTAALCSLSSELQNEREPHPHLMCQSKARGQDPH